MGLSGNGQEELQKLIKSFQQLASKKYLQQMNQSLGAECLALVKGGFDTSTDPYGKTWDPVQRGGMPLRNRGFLKNAWTYTGKDEQVSLENGLVYANMMQNGTAGLPGGKLTPKNKKALSFSLGGKRVAVRSVVIKARKMVPDQGDLPPRWESRLRATADRVMELVMKAQGT